MKTIFLFLLFLSTNRLYSQPTSSEFETFLKFDEKCPVGVQDIEPKKDGVFGDVVWLKMYVPSKSLYRYMIGVSKKGTLLKTDRGKIEQDIRSRPNDMRRMRTESFLYKEVIKTDLGEEFFTIESIEKEMTTMIGFVTVDDYDVFVIEYAISPAYWSEKNPGQPPLYAKKRLPDVLYYIAKQEQKH